MRRIVCLLLSFFISALCLAEDDPGEIAPLEVSFDIAKRKTAPEMIALVKTPPKGNHRRRERLIEMFLEVGASREDITVSRIRNASWYDRNVIVTLHGTDPDAGKIIISAHTDAIGGSPGAIDNWSGSIMLVALYAYLYDHPPRHTVLFAAFGAEELGEEGSKQFVKRLGHDGVRQVRALINLECLGVGTPRIWINQSADSLEHLFFSAACEVGATPRRQVLFGYRSDALPFTHAGVPTVTIHSLGASDLSIINGPNDTPDKIRMSVYRRSFELLTHFLAYVDAEGDAIGPKNKEHVLEAIPLQLYHLGSETEDGVCLGEVPENSLEYESGIRSGDRIVAVESTRIMQLADLLSVLLTQHRGNAFQLAVIAPGQEQSRQITLLYP